jgi:hypothetical protein
MSAIEARLIELEKKVVMLARALNVLLAEGEELPEEEIEEIRARLKDWVEGRGGEFVGLDDALKRCSR